MLGWLRLDAGDASSALWAFEAALRLIQDMFADPALLADLYTGVGEAQLQLGRGEDAECAFRLALETAEPYRDPARVASWHLDRAVSAAGSGQFEAVADQAIRALAVHHTLRHKRRLAEIDLAPARQPRLLFS